MLGRQMACRTIAANSARSSAVPAGPTSSKIVPASAAPNCSGAATCGLCALSI
jgi:hypothetical protein